MGVEMTPCAPVHCVGGPTTRILPMRNVALSFICRSSLLDRSSTAQTADTRRNGFRDLGMSPQIQPALRTPCNRR